MLGKNLLAELPIEDSTNLPKNRHIVCMPAFWCIAPVYKWYTRIHELMVQILL